MKIGCAVWDFTFPTYGAPYEAAIKTIGDLGFDSVELIVFDDHDLTEYYTRQRIRDLKAMCDDRGLEISQLAIHANLSQDLGSLSPEVKRAALANFEKCAQIASELGTKIINAVAPSPEGFRTPLPFPSNYISITNSGEKFRPTLMFELDPDFDWARIWVNYVDTVQKMLNIAGRYGLEIALEAHTYLILNNTEAFLRLFDHIPSSHLGVNFDTAWHLMQREAIPLSIMKLGNRIKHLHLRDGDGRLCYALPPGRGIIDWPGVIQALQRIGYNGTMSFEFVKYYEAEKYARESLQYLRSILETGSAC